MYKGKEPESPQLTLTWLTGTLRVREWLTARAVLSSFSTSLLNRYIHVLAV